MKKKIINIIKYLVFMGLGIFLVWLSIHKIKSNPEEWNEFKLSLSSANYWLFVPVFFIIVLSHIIRALRWRILIQPMGYHVSKPNTFFAVMIGYMANMAVPRLGEVLKCTILARYEKVPAEKIVGTMVAERAIDALSLGLIFLLALIFQFDVVIAAYQELQVLIAGKPDEVMSNTKKIIFLSIAVLIIVLLLWMMFTKRINKIMIATQKIIKGVWEGLISTIRLKHKKLFFFYSLLIWLLYLLGTWVGFYAMQGTTGLSISVAITCLAFASIGMIVTPGGIGTYPALIAIVLSLQQPSIPNSIGYANGTLQWFAQCIIVLLVGFICLILLPWYNRKKQL
ncbi:MAG: flippase-like domain-containing protein [Chitinophagaceae bacterium]|nr:flippase-like domain-containing protein [Chitinophagaceae bacterium]MCW5904624.1 flippase-like domain-containing protein [Chitinophagaceae bacterium]